MPIIKQKMIEFVNNGGATIGQSKPVFVRNAPLIVPSGTADSQLVSNNSDNEELRHLTPLQRMKKRKEEEIRRKQEELTAHSKKAMENYQYAK